MSENYGYISIRNQRALFATEYPTPAQTGGACSVLVLEPLLDEKRPAMRMVVRLCRALQAKGTQCMRFDFSGYGDSSLGHADVTFDTLLEDAEMAAKTLREDCNGGPLALVAMRGSALVAMTMANRLSVERVVLVEPVMTGAELARDWERKATLQASMNGKTENMIAPGEAWKNGKTVCVAGYEVSAEFISGISAISIDESLKDYHGRLSAIRVSASLKLPPSWQCLQESAQIVRDKPFWGQLDYYESDIVNDAIMSCLE